MNNKQIGKFYLSDHFIRKNPEKVAHALGIINFIPFRVEHLYCSGKFLMEGLSDKFEEIKEGELVPFYDILINDLSGKITVSVTKNVAI